MLVDVLCWAKEDASLLILDLSVAFNIVDLYPSGKALRGEDWGYCTPVVPLQPSRPFIKNSYGRSHIV